MSGLPWFRPDWQLPPGVRALATLRGDGDGFDLGERAGGSSAGVAARRERLRAACGVRRVEFLDQVHGIAVHRVQAGDPGRPPAADAVVSGLPGIACAVLTADCLPVLFATDGEERRVAAAHAGWRGLAAGIVEATLVALDVAPERLRVWLGAAIGPESFEVGPEVRAAFLERRETDAQYAAIDACFRPGRGDRFLADLYGLARARLSAAGVVQVSGGGLDVLHDTRFHSFRRDGPRAGRQATLIWLEGGDVNRSS